MGNGATHLAFDWQRRTRNGDRGADANPEAREPAAERRTIGLALGGGGARGFAHIGVIRTLVATWHQARRHCRHLDRRRRRRLPCRRPARRARGLGARADAARLLGYLDISLSGSGLIGGGKACRRSSTRRSATSASRTCRLRFATITTEVGTGHEIWLTRGPMVDAVRASYALPGIFPPVSLDGRWLVDGALVNPVPVSAARVLRRPACDRGQSQFGRPGPQHRHRTARPRHRPSAGTEPQAPHHARPARDLSAPSVRSNGNLSAAPSVPASRP